MDYKRIARDGTSLLFGKIGTIVLSLATLMILTRTLTTEDMGKYSIFLMIVNIAVLLGLNWSDSSIVRHGREELVSHKKINQSFWARMYLFTPILIFFVLVFSIFKKKLTEYMGIETNLMFLVIGVFVLTGILNLIEYIYQSVDQVKKSSFVLFYQRLFYVLALLLLFFKIMPATMANILILINISFVLAIILNLTFFDFRLILPYHLNIQYVKRIWSFSWPQFIGFFGLYAINYVDIYVIKKYMTLADVGTYSIAYNGFTMLSGILLLQYRLFFPLMVEYRTQRKFHLIRKYLQKMTSFLVLWVIIVLVGFFLSDYIIPLIFSESYVGAIPAFKILLISSIFFFLSTYLLPIVNAFDFILYSQIFNLIKCAVNIIADFVLVPKMGIIGAAYGTMLSYIVGCVLTGALIYINRKTVFGERNEK